MNTRAKGRRKENQACTILESMGYVVNMPNPKPKYMEYNGRTGYTDFFSLWDIIAIGKTDIRLIQVKTNKGQTYGKKLAPHRAFVVPSGVKKECWVMRDRTKEPLIIPL